MAFYNALVLLLACSTFSVHCRMMEQAAVGTDSFPLMAENANEAVPYKVVETKDAYEIRDYEEGRHCPAHALSQPVGLLPCERCEKNKLLYDSAALTCLQLASYGI